MAKQSEKVYATTTRRQATRGKVVHLPGSVKRMADSMPDKAARRHFLNMMLDATMTEKESQFKKE